MALADWSPVAADNNTTLGVNIAENCPAANMNNALRKAMADVAGGINVSVLGTFLASTTLANARTALGVGASSTSATNFDLLTNAANKMPLMTGSDAWTTVDAPSFGRSLLASGDASTALTLLGISSGSGSFSGSASSGYMTLNLGGTTFKLQWKDFTATANTTTSVTFPSAFTSWSRSWVNSAVTDTDADQNFATVTTHGTTTATVTTSYSFGGNSSCTLYSIGV